MNPFLTASNRLSPPCLLVLALVACTAACGGSSRTDAGWDLSRTQMSEEGAFRIQIQPPEEIPLHEIHTWRVRVETPGGEPVQGAALTFDGGMPEHQHGLPTRPRVTGEGRGGIYTVEGVKFSMPGHWEIYVSVLSGEEGDTATFHLML